MGIVSCAPHHCSPTKKRKTFWGRLGNASLLLGLTNSSMVPPGVFCNPFFSRTCNGKSLHHSEANACSYAVSSYWSPRIRGLRPVLTLPQDCKGQLALEEVTWVGTQAARKAQGQWCTPYLPITLGKCVPCTETGSVRESARAQAPSARHSPHSQSGNRFLIYKACPAFYTFHNNM